MNIRRFIKHCLYGHCPGFAGAFPYFGTRLYFPRRSLSFRAACDQGVFERDNVRLSQALTKPDTVFLDVGANIGLMSAPVLWAVPGAKVVSFEPSPNTVPYLQRSVSESPYGERWTLMAKAVGACSGEVTFHTFAPENSLFDGIRNTGRVPGGRQVKVEMTSLDATWKEMGSPAVSLIKCDVEGGELAVLLGALECLHATRPAILVEWNLTNIRAYDINPTALVEFAAGHGFEVHAVPSLVEITSRVMLEAQCALTENFLLLPV